MRWRSKQANRQPGLFEAANQGPRWTDFSPETREAVTALVARLIRQQRKHEQQPTAVAAEVERE